MTESEWNNLATNTVGQMRDFARPFVTPIGRMLSDDEGQHEGTGNFIEVSGERFILSNEHVAAALTQHRLTVGFFGSDELGRLAGNAHAVGAPQDVGLWRLNEGLWTVAPHQAATIPEAKFNTSHAPEEGEMLFFQGFAGERSRFTFGSLQTPLTPYLTIEVPLPADPVTNSAFHFALAYNPEQSKTVDSSTRGIPSPPGFSGSLVWDTRRIACARAGKPWHPGEARVTGIIWGWLSGQSCLLATRVECIPLRALAASFP